MKGTLLFTSFGFKFLRIILVWVLILGMAFPGLYAQTSNAMNFDGVDDNAEIAGVNVITTGSYTKEAWIKVNNFPISGLWAGIVSEGFSAFYIQYQGVLANNGPSIVSSAGGILVTGVWYHIAVTFDAASGIMKVFKDGVRVGDGTAGVLSATDLRQSVIGAYRNIYTGVYSNFFDGDIAELRIWNYARSEADIALTYKCGIPATGATGLIAYYKFDEGTAGADNTAITTLVDASGNGNDATLNHFALDGTTSNFTGDFNELAGECDKVLPVTLSYFEAKSQQNTILINWQTASESNNRGFYVERSSDGNSNWKDIAFIDGKGNASAAQNYSYRDERPANGNNYYRLKQVDFDGQFALSKIALATYSVSGSAVLFPTVASGTIFIRQADRSLLKSGFYIYDNTGRPVLNGIIESEPQSVNISKLPQGNYFLRIQGGQVLKFIKK